MHIESLFLITLLCFEGYKRNTALNSPSKVSEVEQALGNEIAAMASSLNLNAIKAVRASTSNQYSESLVDVSEASFKEELSVMPYFAPTEVPNTEDTAGDTSGAMDVFSQTPELSSFTGSSELPSTTQSTKLIRFSLEQRTEGTIQTVPSVDSLPSALLGNFFDKEGQSIQTHSSHQTKACDNQDIIKGLPSETDNPQTSVHSLDKDVGVFFSLQFTNMIFSEDLLNMSSPGYKFLENTFLELVGSLTFSLSIQLIRIFLCLHNGHLFCQRALKSYSYKITLFLNIFFLLSSELFSVIFLL